MSAWKKLGQRTREEKIGLRMTKAVIFDFDGVFIDSFPAWYRVFNFNRTTFGFREISVHEYKMNAWSKGYRAVMDTYFPDKMYAEVVQSAESNFSKYLQYIQLIGNPSILLQELKNKKFKIGLVSNTQKRILLLILKRYKLRKYFDVLISSDDVRKDKPNPQGLLLCLKKLKISKNEAVFIGDTIYDEIAANNAGIKFIGFRRGKNKIYKLDSLLKKI